MVYTEQFYVGYSDCGADMTLSNTALLRYFENIASMHGAAVGDSPLEVPYRWVLLSYHVCVLRRPKFNSRVTLKSWNRAVKGVTSCREFELYDENGDLICTAISNWVRVDAETGKLQRLGEAVAEQYGSEARGNFDSPWIPKLKEAAVYDVEKRYMVERNFIDANRHMNNVCYLDLANCVLPQAVWDKGESNTFSIHYRKASYYGEELTCCYGEEENTAIVAVKGGEGDVRAVVAFER
ncbi:MAG: hypothetical protein J6B99_06065 [Oscillospiraceae bacterium]|nr:hypothetical protein [Oscillospiraceae bacterium]